MRTVCAGILWHRRAGSGKTELLRGAAASGIFYEFCRPWLRRSTAGHHKIPGAVRGRGHFENEVYEGIPEVLAYLKEQGKILAVASSKPEKYVEQILEHFEIRKYFTVVTGSEMNETRTDKGEVIAETLRRLGAEDSRSDVVMVGDRSYDVIGARENGLLCVGVSYGYGGREELEAAGAAKVCDTPEELKLLAEDPKEEKKRRDRIKK